MSKEKAYPEYSDFGQEWLGELPAHWNVVRTKLIFDLVTEPAPVGNSEELLSVYTSIGVKPRKELEARGNKASSTDNYWRVEKGDIIVNKLLAWMGAIGISEYNGVTSPAYDILRPIDNVNPYFYNFLFRNPISSREFKRHSRGIMDMRLRLYFTRLGDIKLPYPPIDEQKKIVEFLKFKLVKINRFIQKKKQLIKLLNEQKATIINQAVTKGLDPNAKMQNSGIEWLGETPEHWEVTPLKYLLKVNGLIRGPFGSALKTDFFVKSGYKVYEQKNAIYKDLTLGTSYIDESKFKELKRFEVFEGDFLMSCSGTIGKLHKVKGEFEKGIINQAMMIMRIKEEKLIMDYFYWLFESEYIKSVILDSSKGSAMKNLVGINEFKSLIIPIPNIKEQEEIILYLNKETDIINTTISKIEKELALTEEYKTALIAEAVTGKIDVRGYEVPEITEEETYEEIEEEISMAAEDIVDYQTEEKQ